MKVKPRPSDKALDPEEGINWKPIPGYYWPYRINEMAQIERQKESGKWVRVKPFLIRCGDDGYRRLGLHMKLPDGRFKNVFVKNLMIDAFLGGRKPGVVYGHRNRSVMDCSLNNLYPTTRKKHGSIVGGGLRKSIEKIDRDGNVLALYSSITEAAEKNYVARTAVQHRCRGRCKGDPFELLGFSFRYEDEDRRGKRAN